MAGDQIAGEAIFLLHLFLSFLDVAVKVSSGIRIVFKLLPRYSAGSQRERECLGEDSQSSMCPPVPRIGHGRLEPGAQRAPGWTQHHERAIA
jgi:hypothetical protein